MDLTNPCCHAGWQAASPPRRGRCRSVGCVSRRRRQPARQPPAYGGRRDLQVIRQPFDRPSRSPILRVHPNDLPRATKGESPSRHPRGSLPDPGSQGSQSKAGPPADHQRHHLPGQQPRSRAPEQGEAGRTVPDLGVDQVVRHQGHQERQEGQCQPEEARDHQGDAQHVTRHLLVPVEEPGQGVHDLVLPPAGQRRVHDGLAHREPFRQLDLGGHQGVGRAQVGIHLVPGTRHRRPLPRVDRDQSHRPHQPPHPLWFGPVIDAAGWVLR
jgi:hypothetical protein